MPFGAVPKPLATPSQLPPWPHLAPARRAFLGLPLLALPPHSSLPGSNPVGRLSIIELPGGIALQLSVPRATAGHIKVLASPPQNAGRRFCADFCYLGLLPPPKGGVSDITEQYVRKFGNPPPGSRVFIRTQQQVDGQQDLPVQIDAIVPGQRGGIRETREIYRKYIGDITEIPRNMALTTRGIRRSNAVSAPSVCPLSALPSLTPYVSPNTNGPPCGRANLDISPHESPTACSRRRQSAHSFSTENGAD